MNDKLINDISLEQAMTKVNTVIDDKIKDVSDHNVVLLDCKCDSYIFTLSGMPTTKGIFIGIFKAPNGFVCNGNYSFNVKGFTVYINRYFKHDSSFYLFNQNDIVFVSIDTFNNTLYIQTNAKEIAGGNGGSILSDQRNIYISDKFQLSEIRIRNLLLGDILHINGHRYMVVDFSAYENYSYVNNDRSYMLYHPTILMTLPDTDGENRPTDIQYMLNDPSITPTSDLNGDITKTTLYTKVIPEMVKIIKNDFGDKLKENVWIPTATKLDVDNNIISIRDCKLTADLPTAEQLGLTSPINRINGTNYYIGKSYKPLAYFAVGYNDYARRGDTRNIWTKYLSHDSNNGFSNNGWRSQIGGYIIPANSSRFVSLIFAISLPT